MAPRPRTKHPRGPHATNAAAAATAPTITAFRLFPTTFAIHPAPRHRGWMETTDERFAYRCLPLVMANQAGWIITSGRTVIARWSGGSGPDALTIRTPEDEEPPASSLFGYGILTWDVPFLFRTTPGYNLLARGPANWWKPGAIPLEGLVETDWSVATFTMNWKLLHPRRAVRFEPDDPVCMIVPQRRGELESFETGLRTLRSGPGLRKQYRAWEKARDAAVAVFQDPSRWPGGTPPFQLHYLRGTSPGGASAPEHQTKLALREFRSDGRRRSR